MKLGVNIDHVATLRQARYRLGGQVLPQAEPCLLDCAEAVRRGGADGITLHLREDRRHIQDQDVWDVRRKIKLPLNLEMAVHPEILKIACELRPSEACLVPEKRQEVTTEGGLDVVRAKRKIQFTVAALHEQGVLVSLFINPEANQVHMAREVGADVVELHTGAFAEAKTARSRTQELRRLSQAAELAHAVGLRVNAGHGLRYSNVHGMKEVPYLETLNIGHSIVSRALEVGLEQAVKEMRRCMR